MVVNINKETRQIKLMGTNIDLMVVHPEGVKILDHLEDLLHIYNLRFSANRDDSELMQINQAAGRHPIKVHPEMYELIALGKEHSLAKESLLNIAIGPLIKLWNIGFDDARVPSQAEIDEVLKIIDPNLIELDEENQTIYLAKAGMEIDVGAIAKGYIADRLVDYMKEQGVASGLVNLGGNLVTVGPALNRPDYYWRIGVQNPEEIRGQSSVTLKIYNQSVVTSGIYERKLTIDGQTYHHIFDQKTGYPVNSDTASITIIADQSVDCEIWTTRLFGQEPHHIINEINQLPGIEGVVITRDGEYLLSNEVNKA
ncbi:FAD:protein FMN transferase [Aerococcaceae bacterium DSM 111176]|nr:FAD:protein FMN transferase [Aerococcaceae bacterium DSM 111176]